jgi:hypothetical protein
MQRLKQPTAIKIKKEVKKKPDYEDMCVVGAATFVLTLLS